MNWVDKKFARENNVLNGAPDLWQKVQTAIEDACNSFKKNKSVPAVERRTENGHAVVVRAIFPSRDNPVIFNSAPSINSVRIVFDEQERLITATLNQGTPKKFKIDSDEQECFLSLQGNHERIEPDRFSELVLSDAFFNEPKPREFRPTSGSPSEWG